MIQGALRWSSPSKCTRPSDAKGKAHPHSKAEASRIGVLPRRDNNRRDNSMASELDPIVALSADHASTSEGRYGDADPQLYGVSDLIKECVAKHWG
eukprot:7445547-Pyramimonas_sp.AAC.1